MLYEGPYSLSGRVQGQKLWPRDQGLMSQGALAGSMDRCGSKKLVMAKGRCWKRSGCRLQGSGIRFWGVGGVESIFCYDRAC